MPSLALSVDTLLTYRTLFSLPSAFTRSAHSDVYSKPFRALSTCFTYALYLGSFIRSISSMAMVRDCDDLAMATRRPGRRSALACHSEDALQRVEGGRRGNHERRREERAAATTKTRLTSDYCACDVFSLALSLLLITQDALRLCSQRQLVPPVLAADSCHRRCHRHRLHSFCQRHVCMCVSPSPSDPPAAAIASAGVIRADCVPRRGPPRGSAPAHSLSSPAEGAPAAATTCPVIISIAALTCSSLLHHGQCACRCFHRHSLTRTS